MKAFESHRVVCSNAAYIALFPTVRDRSAVRVLARRCFPDHPEILTAAFDRLLREPETASYVLLDLRPRLGNEALRVRHSFRLDAPLVAYQPAVDADEEGAAGAARKRRP